MIKKSYPNPNSELTGPSNDLTPGESSTETGARGINSTEMTSTFDSVDPISKHYLNHEEDNSVPDEILDLLTNLGDEMDKQDEEVLANFSDFLIKKFAQAKNIDYNQLFNNLMIKINNADLVHTNEIIKKLAKIYSRTLVLEYMENEDLEKSKESAYKKILHRAEQYLSED